MSMAWSEDVGFNCACLKGREDRTECKQTQCSQNRPTAVLSCLTRHRAAFQRLQAKAASHAAEACAEDRALSSGCTWSQSLAPCTQDQKTGMELALELELQNLSKSKGSIVQECPLLMSLTIDGQAPRSSNHHLLCQCFCIPVPGEPLKPAPNPGSGSSSFEH